MFSLFRIVIIQKNQTLPCDWPQFTIIWYFRDKKLKMDGQLFHGMTINNILEKVDLFNFVFDEDEAGNKEMKDGSTLGPCLNTQATEKTLIKSTKPTSAYLGTN